MKESGSLEKRFLKFGGCQPPGLAMPNPDARASGFGRHGKPELRCKRIKRGWEIVVAEMRRWTEV